MKRSLFGAVAALSLFAAGSAVAETGAEKKSDKDVFVGGSTSAGGDVMLDVGCAGCHGGAGKNTTSDITPRLAGQSAKYIYTQLKAFANGTRKTESTMAQEAAKLNDQQARDVAAYLAKQDTPTGGASKKVADFGRQIYFNGNPDTKVPACSACHGPLGRGNAAASYPSVAGQKAAYLLTQLEAYQAGTRYTKTGDDLAKHVPVAQVMIDVAANMTPEEMQAVSSFMQGLYLKAKK